MTRDDIIRMARETGMPPAEIITDKPVVYPVPESLERFAALVAAAEREACADLCEGHYDTAQAARAIRARGNK